MISTLDPTSPEAESVITFRMRELAQKHGLGDDALEDLGQEMRLHLWSKRDTYKPGVAKPSTYMAVLARNRAASVLRDQRALIRGGGVAPAGLDSPEPDARRDQHEDEVRLRRLGQSPRPADDNRCLELDMQSVLKTLPPRLRRLCLKALSPGGLGCIKSKQNQADVQQIREHFIAAGLPAYLVAGADAEEFTGADAPRSARSSEEGCE